jgi:predicted amino acid racemase
MATPRLEINLDKIAHNTKVLSQLYGSKSIDVCAVTKVVCGDLTIAKCLVTAGITMIADSKVANLKKMRKGDINATFLLIGTPLLSQAAEIVEWADISHNSEPAVIAELGRQALKKGINHQIILMIEMGDLREGIMPESLDEVVNEVLKLEGIELIGLGTNLACFGSIQPSQEKMNSLSKLSDQVERKFHLKFRYVSGGNSANYNWFKSTHSTERINQLRIGESIFLGVEPVHRHPIPDLFTDAFTVVTEVCELKIKPSVPYGETGQNAFGHVLQFTDKGEIPRAILGMGLQDVDVSGLRPMLDIDILGAGSDQMIIDPKNTDLRVGDEVSFMPNYAALLSAMTSPYVEKSMTLSCEREGIL